MTFKQEWFSLARLAGPLAAANFGQMLLGAVGTAIVGRVGAKELGAAGLGNALFFTISILGIGSLMGLDPLVSQAHGAGEQRLARRILWQGVWLGFIIIIPLGILMLAAGRQLERIGIDPGTAEYARQYLGARIWGLLPFMLFAALRAYLQSVGLALPMLFAALLANIINVPICWLLVFGDAGFAQLGLPAVQLGLPALGVAGAAYANAISAMLQLAVLLLAVRYVNLPAGEDSLRRPELALMRRTLSIGVPIGFTLLAEVGIFSLASLAMGNLGETELAAHQVAITLASGAFMLSMGIGGAASARVGRAVGAGDMAGVRRASLVALFTGLGVTLLSGALFWIFPQVFARLITDQVEVIAAALPLIFVAALFQISDGSQAVLAGALRGAGDTKIPLATNLAGYYLLAAPLGLWLAFRTSLGGQGIWWGLSAGLTCVALVLGYRLYRVTRRELGRV